MALTSAEKQKAYRDRERAKLEALRKAANGAASRGNVTDDGEVAALKAKLANAEALALKMARQAQALREELNRRPLMDLKTRGAISKILHPDHKPSEEQRAEACRLFNSWRDSNNRAQRKAR
jgi:hypothetical protein